MTETNATHATVNPIDEAKAYAHEAIRETYPTVRETEEPTNASYEYKPAQESLKKRVKK